MMRRLTAADPSDAGRQRDVAELREGYGRALVAVGRLPLAGSEADAVQQLAGGLLKSDPEDRRAVRILSLSHTLHARVWAAQRQATLADRASEQAASLSRWPNLR